MDSLEDYFRIDYLLGEGQFAKVYRAKYKNDGHKYAIKVVSHNVLDQHYISNEIKIGSMLNHPKIANIKFLLRFEGYSCIAMEYVNGCTLNRIIDSRQLTEEQAKLYAIEIADALHYLHAHGLVHRDIKPSNIMVTSKGLKLIDLGTISFSSDPEEQDELNPNRIKDIDSNIANEPLTLHTEKFIRKEWEKTSCTKLENMDILQTSRFRCGTLLYLAPEGKTPIVTSKLDIWAFACLIFKMVSGVEINHPSEPNNVAEKARNRDFSFLKNFVSPDLYTLLSNMLAFDHKERYDIKQVLQSSWFNSCLSKRFKFAYCMTCEKFWEILCSDELFILCISCQKIKKESLNHTGGNDWMFYQSKDEKMNNREIMLSNIENWGAKNITTKQIENLMSLADISKKPSYHFGLVVAWNELKLIKSEQSRLKNHFDNTEHGCDYLIDVCQFISNPISFFSNFRSIFTRLSISRIQFLINTYFLSVLDAERKSNRGFDFNLRVFERIGITKIVIQKTKGRKEDLNYLHFSMKSLIRKFELINGLDKPTYRDYCISKKMTYIEKNFIEERINPN